MRRREGDLGAYYRRVDDRLKARSHHTCACNIQKETMDRQRRPMPLRLEARDPAVDPVLPDVISRSDEREVSALSRLLSLCFTLSATSHPRK